MSSTVRPFTGRLPTSAFGTRVVGPSKSLIDPTLAEAGADDPLSFRHRVGRGAGPSADEALAWLASASDHGALRAVEQSIIVHSATRDGRTSRGVLAEVSIDAYERNAVKAHEKTIAANEQKMTGYMLLTRLYGNPVVLTHRRRDALAKALAQHSAGPPDVEFEAIDRTTHRFWIVDGSEASHVAALAGDELYIADGHHRLEAARALAAAEGRADSWFPAGLYADDEVSVWAFARGVRNSGVAPAELIDRLASTFDLVEVDDALPRPTAPGSFGVRVDGRGFILTIADDQVHGDAHARLDVSLLQRLVLEPMLGIADPRHDHRLDVIADSGDDAHDPDLYDAWFLPFPTSPGEVMDVADLGRTMPPKSTYFLPKLPSGIMVRPLDD